ncbi:SCO2522 family protein [Dactylosporangium maewongense]|uniref:SCO2522 family protein n=1 Tax=Dactylosporangium maewongense TaxID=634393 RepID=A0ABN2AI55_9ACTN
MSVSEVVFRESVAQREVASIPLSHVSIELGHLYAEQFNGGDIDAMRRHFAEIAPWVEAARQSAARRAGRTRPRISTCFLVDDYFTRFSTPAELIPLLVKAAAEAGLTIDYLARESGCATTDRGIPLADMLVSRIVDDPPPLTNGWRPPSSESGWLCNGVRSPQSVPTAMNGAAKWQKPQENAANRHSIFLDVELWSDEPGGRLWSCPLLAAVWQLLRLGMLRYQSEDPARPARWHGDLPAEWEQLPAIVRLNEQADPFSAYQTYSILSGRFVPVETAVRTILGQTSVEAAVLEQLATRARAEGIELPATLIERIRYAFP